MEKALRFSAIVYNHDAFLLLFERKVLHKLKVLRVARDIMELAT